MSRSSSRSVDSAGSDHKYSILGLEESKTRMIFGGATSCAGLLIILGAVFVFGNPFQSGGAQSASATQTPCSKLTAPTPYLECIQKRSAFFKAAIADMKPEHQAIRPKFEEFLVRFGRDYHEQQLVTEYRIRLIRFLQTVNLIAERNAAEVAKDGGTPNPNRTKHGINKFADWSPEEFISLLGAKDWSAGETAANTTRRLWGRPRPLQGGTASCTASHASEGQVRNQGQCGDCWTFSTAEAIRLAYIQQHGTDPGELSTQYMVDCMNPGHTCSGGVNGCCGGIPSQAMEWISRQGGIPTADAYGDRYPSPTRRLQTGPVSHEGRGNTYSGQNPTTKYPCKQNIPKAVGLSGAPRTLQGEANMAEYICQTGSLSITVDATSWQTYESGVVPSSTCGTQNNHAVLLVGLDQQQNAWVVRNSWATDYGVAANGQVAPHDEYSNCASLAAEGHCNDKCGSSSCSTACAASCGGPNQITGGYILLQYGSNTCGIEEAPVEVPQTTVVSSSGGGLGWR